MFYFYHDIDTIIPRFMESDDEIYKKKKEALGKSKENEKKNSSNELVMKEIRDYLPVNTALRIKDFITFSVKIEGEAPDLLLSKDESIKIKRLKFKIQEELREKFEEELKKEEE